MTHRLDPVQLRRLMARTLRVALDGGSAAAHLLERWADAEASEATWIAAVTWDGIGASLGWALEALGLREVAPHELDQVAADAYAEAREHAVQLSADLQRLGVEFEAVGIPAVALKGSALLALGVAPAPGVRWMRDLDILVPESEVEGAAWILESLDYARGASREPSAPEPLRAYHETFESPGGGIVELHRRLGPARWGRAAASGEWFRRAGPSSFAGVLVPDPADLFWHFLLHDARNHAWSTGSLRAAFDLALAARTSGFALSEVIARLADDPRPEALFEAIADAANLSAILAREVEPSAQPRYLRLARWRDTFGRRRWPTQRIAVAIAWGATLDRTRRHGGWDAALDRAMRFVPGAASDGGVLAQMWRAALTVRHATFVGMLALGHFITQPKEPYGSRPLLPRRASRR